MEKRKEKKIKVQLTNYLLLISSIFLGSCSLGNFNEPQEFTQLENQLELRLLPSLNFENVYHIRVGTTTRDHCAESTINTSISSEGASHQLRIESIDQPENCDLKNQEAFTHETISFSGDNAKIEIVLADRILSNASLARAGDNILINSDALQGINFASNALGSWNSHNIWSGVFSTKQTHIELYNYLMVEILSEMPYTEIVDGNYGYFTVYDDTNSFLHPAEFRSTTSGFAYRLAENFVISDSRIEQLVLDFKMSHPEVDFFVALGDGRIL